MIALLGSLQNPTLSPTSAGGAGCVVEAVLNDGSRYVGGMFRTEAGGAPALLSKFYVHHWWYVCHQAKVIHRAVVLNMC